MRVIIIKDYIDHSNIIIAAVIVEMVIHLILFYGALRSGHGINVPLPLLPKLESNILMMFLVLVLDFMSLSKCLKINKQRVWFCLIFQHLCTTTSRKYSL